MFVPVKPYCVEDPSNCLFRNKILPVISDSGEELTETIRENHDICVKNQNNGLLIIVTWNRKTTRNLLKQTLTDKDGYLIINKQQEWLPYNQIYGNIYIFICFRYF